MNVNFNAKVKNVTFQAIGEQPGHAVIVHVLRGSTDLGTITLNTAGKVDLKSFGKITGLAMDDTSTLGGINAYAHFKFKPAPVQADAPPDAASGPNHDPAAAKVASGAAPAKPHANTDADALKSSGPAPTKPHATPDTGALKSSAPAPAKPHATPDTGALTSSAAAPAKPHATPDTGALKSGAAAPAKEKKAASEHHAANGK